MQWTQQFDCFLFDFDGLLVNTEHLHFLAYQEMCKSYRIELTWDFKRFCQAAHFHSEGVKYALYEEYPSLYQKQPDWNILYKEKKEHYQNSLKEGHVQLMPGALELLKALQEQSIPCCVVTHSPQQQVEAIKHILPDLQTIPYWITRHDYGNPKPAPDSYLCALKKVSLSIGRKINRPIGFEDALRGLRALQAAQISSRVLICSKDHPQMEIFREGDAYHFESIESVSL